MAMLTQSITAAIALVVGYVVFGDGMGNLRNFAATLSLILIVVLSTALSHFLFFSRSAANGWSGGSWF